MYIYTAIVTCLWLSSAMYVTTRPSQAQAGKQASKEVPKLGHAKPKDDLHLAENRRARPGDTKPGQAKPSHT